MFVIMPDGFVNFNGLSIMNFRVGFLNDIIDVKLLLIFIFFVALEMNSKFYNFEV